MARPVGIKGKQTRQRILGSSLKLFARSGYAAVSMREIAEAVGVGPGALYNHFQTKQHILMAIMEEHMRALLAAYADKASPPARPKMKPQQQNWKRLCGFISAIISPCQMRCFYLIWNCARWSRKISKLLKICGGIMKPY